MFWLTVMQHGLSCNRSLLDYILLYIWIGESPDLLECPSPQRLEVITLVIHSTAYEKSPGIEALVDTTG